MDVHHDTPGSSALAEHDIRAAVARSALAVTAVLGWAAATPLAAQDVYGGKIPPKDVSPDVEACEYQLLVEDQTCNERINKSTCIREIHRYCLENYSDLPFPGPRASGIDKDREPSPDPGSDPEREP